eukprot:Filipodium_phascolosomae@DN2431_c0_g2_i1.p2
MPSVLLKPRRQGLAEVELAGQLAQLNDHFNDATLLSETAAAGLDLGAPVAHMNPVPSPTTAISVVVQPTRNVQISLQNQLSQNTQEKNTVELSSSNCYICPFGVIK